MGRRQKPGMENGGTAHEDSTEGTMPPWKIGLRDVADRLLSLYYVFSFFHIVLLLLTSFSLGITQTTDNGYHVKEENEDTENGPQT